MSFIIREGDEYGSPIDGRPLSPTRRYLEAEAAYEKAHPLSGAEALAGLVGGLLSIGIISLLVAAATAFYQALFLRIETVPVYRGVMFAVGIALLGGAFAQYRKRRWSAIVQIVVAALAGTYSVLWAAKDTTSFWIGLVASVVAVGNGFAKLWDIDGKGKF